MTESNFLYHTNCDSCGSKDNVAVYDDGHTFCFGCQNITRENEVNTPTQTNKTTDLIPSDVNEIASRKIDFNTVQKFNYGTGDYFGRACQVANYYNSDRELVAQKLRYPSREFQWLGDVKQATLFGQHLWGSKGKMVVITEGEIDALSVSKLWNNKFPVVSIKTGAAGAKKDISKELEWLENFDSVVLCFDQDDAGKKAAAECARLFSPNKAKICTLPLKDANEMIVAGKYKELTDCIWSAKPYRPDGIVCGTDIWDTINKEDEYVSVDYPFPALNIKTHGLRKGELVTITAGSGVGKSSFCRHIALHLLQKDFKVGYIALEESIKRTSLGIMGVSLQKPLHLTREGVKEDELRDTYDATVGNGNFYLYNHFGSTVADNLIAKIRYMAKACACDYIILDHLHMALSSLGDEHTNDERKLIDYTVSVLRTLVEETGIGLILVSHLRRSEGDKGWEDGKSVTMNALRGSASIGQLSDLIISMNRDLQAEDNTTIVTILKNRFSGETGHACNLNFDLETGCLAEIIHDDF